MKQGESVRDVYSNNLEEINLRIKNSKFPMTFQVLRNSSLKIDDMLNSLKCIKANRCYYSSQGLMRIMYEHYLLSFYIWMKCKTEKTDECATDYSISYPIYELMKQENYNSKLDKSYDKSKTPLQNFLIKAPAFNDPLDPMNQQNVDSINSKANQFDIRYILRYLRDDLDPKEHFQPLHTFIHDICMQYNRISSYVHGGRSAEIETFERISADRKEEIMSNNLEFAEIFSWQIVDFIMMLLVEEDSSFLDIYVTIGNF